MKAALMVSTYNGEKVIDKCVRSLLNTKYEPKEVLIVIDGSDDGTLKALEKFSGKIRILEKKRGGVGDSRNFGLKHADADLVAITDDDCEVDPDWVSEASGYFTDDRVAAVTGCKKYKITNLISAVRSMEYHTRFVRRGKEANSVECPVVVFNRDAILKVGGFTSRSLVGGEDTDIGYKLKEAGYRIIYEPRMVVYHDPEDSMKIYLKRNYRNAKAYVWVFYNRSKKEAMTDDFFPWLLLAQPFLTILWVLSGVMIFFNVWFILLLLFLTLFIFGSFVPVIKEVVRLKGRGIIIPAAWQLFLRNVAWCCGLVTGVLDLFRVSAPTQREE